MNPSEWDRGEERVPETSQPPVSGGAAAGSTPAWEQIENGRYMPRRIRGSCLGRELG
jgi:hypothetical protein